MLKGLQEGTKAFIERIKNNEGFRSTVYKDHLGFDTIGYGFAIKDMYMYEEVASLQLTMYLEEKYNHLDKNLDWFSDMPPEIQGVILEMVYQMGFSGFCKFKKAISNMKSKDWKGAATEMLDSKWAKSDSPGRANRLADIIREHG